MAASTASTTAKGNDGFLLEQAVQGSALRAAAAAASTASTAARAPAAAAAASTAQHGIGDSYVPGESTHIPVDQEQCFDMNMLSEDLRKVMLNIRSSITAAAPSSALAVIPSSRIFQNAALTPTQGEVDPRKHLSWLLLGYSAPQGQYIGEAVELQGVKLAEELQSLALSLVYSLEDLKGSRMGRALNPALAKIVEVGCAFLTMALRPKIGLGPMTAHHVLIKGEFRIDAASNFGVTPMYNTMGEVARPIVDGIYGIQALMTELQALEGSRGGEGSDWFQFFEFRVWGL